MESAAEVETLPLRVTVSVIAMPHTLVHVAEQAATSHLEVTREVAVMLSMPFALRWQAERRSISKWLGASPTWNYTVVLPWTVVETVACWG